MWLATYKIVLDIIFQNFEFLKFRFLIGLLIWFWSVQKVPQKLSYSKIPGGKKVGWNSLQNSRFLPTLNSDSHLFTNNKCTSTNLKIQNNVVTRYINVANYDKIMATLSLCAVILNSANNRLNFRTDYRNNNILYIHSNAPYYRH